MLNHLEFLSQFKTIFERNKIISISGESGTGKTTLALQLVSNFMTEKTPFKKQCVWIQASELFPKKRLNIMFKKNPEKLNFLNKNIYIFPGKKPFSNYTEQYKILENIENLAFPPYLKYIVIDNISHHLRYSAFNSEDINTFGKIVNNFYDNQLFPLIMLCQRENLNLILIHEVSFSPDLNTNVPFLQKLYKRIKKVDIILQKSLFSDIKQMRLISEYNTQYMSYEISDIGFLWF